MNFYNHLIFLFVFCPSAYGDKESIPQAFFEVSYGKKVIFKMVPDVYHYENSEKVIDKPAHGTAYILKDDGQLKVFWSVEGWYANKVFLSSNGKYLVRMGRWPKGHIPKEDHLALAFYKNGKLLNSYSTTDLIEEFSNVRTTVSHYFWQDIDDHNYPKMSWPFFEVKTVENNIISFNYETGEKVVRIIP